MASSDLAREAPDESLLTLMARLFAKAGLRGAIIGGVARNHWVIARNTFDLDFTVMADAVAQHFVIAEMEQRGFKVLREQERSAPSGPDFVQLYNPETHQMVEFQGAKTPYQDLLIERSVAIEDLEPLRVVTREDLIILKLIAFRDKDQDDLRQVSKTAGIDWEYIAYWANIWAVEHRLAALRSMLGMPPLRPRE